MSTVIKVDIISDLLCPWCYIGQIVVDRAIQQARDAGLPARFDVRYHPFFLYPSLTDTPVNKMEYYHGVYGEEKFTPVMELVALRSKQEGLNLTWPKGVMRQSTLEHRLLLKAYLTGGQAKQQKLLTALFKAFFEEDKDIGAAEVLAGVAEEAGVFEKSEALAFLNSKDLEAEVNAMSDDAARKGITGVPFAIIDGKWAIGGGQESDVYFKIFEKLAHQKDMASPSIPAAGITATA